MFDDSKGFLSRSFLQREWALEYKAWRGSDEEAALLDRLRRWAARPDLKERSSEGAFIQTFFVETWGYQLGGRGGGGDFTAWPGYPVQRAGSGGATGEADLALGLFGETATTVPQVLCEFKDIRSNLDAPQARKGNTRSPVKQCLDYLQGARRDFFGNEPLLPWWGVVSDMNEFRLYWWDRMPKSYLRFVIRSAQPLLEPDLTDDTEDARFDRFVFARVFSRDRLMSMAGLPSLLRLIQKQGDREKALEGEFYQDYRAVREHLFTLLRQHNPAYPGTPGQLLRLAQKILDRFIFAFYCEDMGARMLFPPQLIRDLLKRRSVEEIFDPKGDELWSYLKRLFRAMDTGDRLGQVDVRAFNGGLFRADPEIDALDLPNDFFCIAGQGANDATIRAHPKSLLHLCASYDYAARGDARQSISLYTLGRIFEQSITELEIEEARLDGRLSLAEVSKRKLPKRKRDGVYYTPEWVVETVVEGALGAWFSDAKAACGWTGEAPATLIQLDAYAARVASVRIVDPACGSGAFLIGAFRRLSRERLELHGYRQSLLGRATAFDETAATAAILGANLFGVDINPAAVEIAKLALWLHSARADAPLSSLDEAVLCGNSLIGPGYWKEKQGDAITATATESVNAFDWKARFGFAEDPGLFDVVIGNPPYVKLQNLRQVDSDVADYLLSAREHDFYASAQTGNFDLYLPFIEKGLALLRTGGQMGYIAPNIWTIAEYGAGLRTLVREGRNLRRWVDFKSHQIFDDVTVYTALQFFSKAANDTVVVIQAPNGEANLAGVDYRDPGLALAYERLPHAEPWLLVTGEERDLIDRLASTCARLDDPSLTTGIIVGIQTSADAIFHLQKVRAGVYRCKPEGKPPYEVEIEDAIMRPLVSGAEAKRYEEPATNTFILFPYRIDQPSRAILISRSEMEANYPKAWAYLRSWESELRARETKRRVDGDIRPFDDVAWYRFGRSQNIGKQELPKLLVPRIVTDLKSYFDVSGEYYLDNVDVGGVTSHSNRVASFLNAILNGRVSNYVFRRISKPFANDYRSANRQFIAPIPVPRVSDNWQESVGQLSLTLQRLWTSKRDLRVAVAERLGSMSRARHDEAWLWSDLPREADLEERAPVRLRLAGDRRDWARARLSEEIELRRAALQSVLSATGELRVEFRDGELRLTSGGSAALSRIYLGDDEGALTGAYWDWLLLSGRPTDAKAFSEDLRRPPLGGDLAAGRQFIEKVAQLGAVTREIVETEREMNALLFDLYDLTVDERRLVAAD